MLAGYRRRDGRYPYLAADPTAHTAGPLVLNLTVPELARLDDYEGVAPTLIEGAWRRLYTRASAEVTCRDGRKVCCWLYLPNLDEWPSAWRWVGPTKGNVAEPPARPSF